MENKKTMVYRPDRPFCTVKKEDLKRLQTLADEKKGFEIMLHDLGKRSWWKLAIAWGSTREYIFRKKEFEAGVARAAAEKKKWWYEIRKRYGLGEKPAIVDMITGHILLGEPKEATK